MTKQKVRRKRGKYLKRKPRPNFGPALSVLCAVFLLVSFLLFFAALWYVATYGDIGFDSVMYTIFSDLGGVQSGLVLSFCLKAVLPGILCAGAATALLFFRPFKGRRLIALALSLVLLTHGAISTGLPSYIYGLFNESPLFETYYVDPDTVEITFPEEKRNLIYIYLESMEISYLPRDLGGGVENNLIPELYTLAQENLNFSHNSGVGGFRSVTGTTWTIAAMVAHTAGVPLKTPPGVAENDYGQNGEGFLPGITSITDILDEAGYYQTLMVGSVASFGGRRQYYTQHGIDRIYDLSTARRDGIVPPDYFVWWGMEDKYLFEYAKQELKDISNQDEPFAFTLLTVDTHHIGGYVCEYCGSNYEEQYENVISCSSRQVLEFVEWIKQQDFYENTTIIITGDHPSMDNGYFSRNVEDGYIRRIYNCFINCPVDTQHSKNRQFSSLDMFPTTLVAIGCTIEGDRLGLGTNLFSGVPTLIESMGYNRFDNLVSMASDYYAEQFRLEVPEEEESTAP